MASSQPLATRLGRLKHGEGRTAVPPSGSRAGWPSKATLVVRPHLYTTALQHARDQEYEEARNAFKLCCTTYPSFSKAWVSWAQFEKRYRQLDECRKVLQRGLGLNPHDAQLCQAFGLLCLQQGHLLAAVLLLERSARNDERCLPVLRWRAVQLARTSVASCRAYAKQYSHLER